MNSDDKEKVFCLIFLLVSLACIVTLFVSFLGSSPASLHTEVINNHEHQLVLRPDDPVPFAFCELCLGFKRIDFDKKVYIYEFDPNNETISL